MVARRESNSERIFGHAAKMDVAPSLKAGHETKWPLSYPRRQSLFGEAETSFRHRCDNFFATRIEAMAEAHGACGRVV